MEPFVTLWTVSYRFFDRAGAETYSMRADSCSAANRIASSLIADDYFNVAIDRITTYIVGPIREVPSR